LHFVEKFANLINRRSAMEISEDRKTELFRRIMNWSDDSLDWLQFQLSVELQERDRRWEEKKIRMQNPEK